LSEQAGHQPQKRIFQRQRQGVLERLSGIRYPAGFEKRFIYDSYATRKGKGVHKAIARAQYFMRKNPWYLKMDIKQYFASINHEALIRLINRVIKDPFIMELCKAINGMAA
jgi:retron-type reverse transcriptase